MIHLIGSRKTPVIGPFILLFGFSLAALFWLTTYTTSATQADGYTPVALDGGPNRVASERPSASQSIFNSSFILINDGSFEENPSAWAETINDTPCGNISKIGDWSYLTGFAAYDGDQSLFIGGTCLDQDTGESTPFVGTAEQQILVPEVQTLVSFRYYTIWTDPNANPADAYAYLDVDGNRHWMAPAGETNDWVEQRLDLSQYAGSEVVLRFGNEARGNIFIDYIGFLPPPSDFLYLPLVIRP
jgi:hypothetical protein